MAHALRHIWVTYDGEAADDRAYDLALELARPLGARLTLVHVADPALEADEPVTQDDVAAALLPSGPTARWRARLTGIALAEKEVDVRPLVVVGALHQALGELLARVQPDLVVAATRGVGRPRDVLRGGVAQHLLRQTSVPLLLVGPQAGVEQRGIAVAARERAYGVRTLVARTRLGRLVNTSPLPVLVDPR